MSPLRGPLLFHCITHLISWAPCQHPPSRSVRVLSPQGHMDLIFLCTAKSRPAPDTWCWWSPTLVVSEAARRCADRPVKPREAPPALVPSGALACWLGSGAAPCPVASVGSSPMCREWGQRTTLSLPISGKVPFWQIKRPSTWGWAHHKMASVFLPNHTPLPM